MYILIVNSNNCIKKYGNCSGVTIKVFFKRQREKDKCKIYNP